MDDNLNEDLDQILFFSENSCFMHISGSLDNLGKILKTDENSKNFFGYDSISSFKGQNITFIMPKIFSKQHDGYLRRFLRTGVTKFLFTEQSLFARKYNNEIFRIHVTIQPFFDKSTQSLEFLSHIKPNNSIKNASTVIVNEMGFIDSIGGPIKDILNPLFDEYKTNFYIQVLIPQLEYLFLEKFNSNIKTIKSTVASSAIKIGKKTGKVSSISKVNQSWKKIKTFIDKQSQSNIVNLRIYEKYPTIPAFFDIEDETNKNENKKKRFLHNLSSLVKKNNTGCSIYRMECNIEELRFDGLSMKVLNITNVKYLYFRTPAEIKRIDSKNVQALFILPKIIMQTASFRRRLSKRKRSFCESEFENKTNDIEKDIDHIIKLEKLTDKRCSIFEMKDYLCKTEDTSEKLQKIYNDKSFRHALSLNNSRNSPRASENNNVNPSEQEEPSLDKKKFIKMKTSATPLLKQSQKPNLNLINVLKESPPLLKVQQIFGHGVNENMNFPKRKISADRLSPSNALSPRRNSKNNFSEISSQIEDEGSVLPSDKLSYQKHNILIQDYDKNLKSSKEPKFFAENKRFIYKFDSFVNENSNAENLDLGAKMVQELKFNPNQEKDKSSIGSTQVENPLDRKDDLIRMIDEPYIPHSCKSFRFFQLVLLVSSLLSLGLLAYLSTTVSNNVQSALSEYSFIEKFKTQLLDSLMLTQEAIVFGNSRC